MYPYTNTKKDEAQAEFAKVCQWIRDNANNNESDNNESDNNEINAQKNA